jgi:hypothetical protein
MKAPLEIFRSATAAAGLLLTPRCADVTRLLSEQREHPLPWLLRKRLDWHLAICDLCRRYGQQIAMLPAFLQRYAQDFCAHGDPQLSAGKKQAIKEAIRREP